MLAFLGVIGVTMFYGTTLGVCRRFGIDFFILIH